MGEISQELIKFKSSVEGNISNMKSTCDDLATKTHIASEACKTAKSSFSASYNSENKAILSKLFDSIGSLYGKIESSVSSTLKNAVTEADSLLTDVTKLEEINTVIASNQNLANTTDDENQKNGYQNIVNEKNNEFNTLHDSALEKLSKLKAIQDDLSDTLTEITTGNKDDIKVEGGVFTKKTFQGSNGVTVTYYMYVPTVKEGDGKLPMLVYFHGMKETLDKYSDRGLGGLINTKKIEPEGIVILPQAENGTADKDFCSKNYEEAVIELVKDTAKKYNGDLNRVSVSGHSNGGSAVYHIVNNYPGFFAAAAPIAGTGKTDQGVMQTNLLALWGSNDSNVSRDQALGVAIKLKKQGYNSNYYVFNGKGHEIQTLAFQTKLDLGDGQSVTLLDWLMSKKLNS